MSRTVLITGATSGFGKACADLFYAKGDKVIVTGRRRDRLDEMIRDLDPARIHPICFDVRERDSVAAAISSLPAEFSAVDVLINNAGLALGLEMAHEAHLEDWDAMVDTNIKGLLYMTRRILPDMVTRNSGHIVNIGSVAGSFPYPGGNAYGATKAFVSQFTNNLKADLRGTAVRVTNIEPGLAETEFSKVRFKWDEGKADSVYTGTKPLTPMDIAEAIYWAVDRPPHVNINRIEIMPVCQSFGPFVFDRKG